MATTSQLAAFIHKKRNEPALEITTLDGKRLLEAHCGAIDTCPDRSYLEQKLLPCLDSMKLGQMPIPALYHVSKSEVSQYTPPAPDWNYLYWIGYSNKEFDEVSSPAKRKNCVCFHSDEGPRWLLFRADAYQDNHNLAVDVFRWTESGMVFEECITVNTWEKQKRNVALIGEYRCSPELRVFMEQSGIAIPTGKVIQEPHDITMWEYQFSAEKLREMDAMGYEKYLALYKGKQPDQDQSQNRDSTR